jgi:hypothetical protein
MAASKNISVERIIGVMRKYGGIRPEVCKELGITRQTLFCRIKNSPTLQAAELDIEEENLDIGEGHIINGLREGKERYVFYYLDHKGKRRGYGNTAQISLDDAQLREIVAAFGGDVTKLRAFRDSLAKKP